MIYTETNMVDLRAKYKMENTETFRIRQQNVLRTWREGLPKRHKNTNHKKWAKLVTLKINI